MPSLRKLAASFLFSSSAAVAQMPPVEQPHADIAVLLDLDATRAQKVYAIMKMAHERMEAARVQIGRPTDETTRAVLRAAMDAIRTDTDRRLAMVLTADELEKLRAARPQPATKRWLGG
jgi:hypothetical protein